MQKDSQDSPVPKFVFRGSEHQVTCICMMQDEKTFLSGDLEGYLTIWDLSSRRNTRRFKAHADQILAIRTLPNDSNKVLTQGRDHLLCLWSLEEAGERLEWQRAINALGFCQAQLDTRNNSIVYVEKENKADFGVLSLSDLKVSSGGVPDKVGMAMAFSLHGTFLWVGYENGWVYLYERLQDTWNIITKQECFKEPILSLDACESNDRLIVVGASSDAILFEFTNNSQLIERKRTNLGCFGSSIVKIRPDMKIIAIGCWDGTIRILSYKTLRLLAVLDSHRDGITDLVFFGTNHILASSRDNTISLWQIY